MAPRVVSQLAPETTQEQLAAYLSEHHALLAPLLPDDTKTADLFGEVKKQRSVASFFKSSTDDTVAREFKRLEQKIEVWLDEAATVAKKRAAQDRHAASKKQRKKQDEEPPPPPVMAFGEAQLVAATAAAARKEKRSKEVFEKGWTGRFSLPGANASAHQAFFKEDPAACCEVVGAQYKQIAFGEAVVFFDGEALSIFEQLKRDSKPQRGKAGQGKGLRPHANFSVVDAVTRGADPITWQDFFGPLVSHAYKKSDTVLYKTALGNTIEQLTALESAEVDEVPIRFAPKLAAANRKIATADNLRA